MATEDQTETAERITHTEAYEIAKRYNRSHWRSAGERARYSIPADPRRDDDLRLYAYIKQNEARDAALARVAAGDYTALEALAAYMTGKHARCRQPPVRSQAPTTAAELYEIVKDVPREAWPAHLSYVPEKWWMYGGPPSGEYVAPSLAADAFIGSIAAYLVARSDDRLQIVQILAAACKLRNPKPDTLST